MGFLFVCFVYFFKKLKGYLVLVSDLIFLWFNGIRGLVVIVFGLQSYQIRLLLGGHPFNLWYNDRSNWTPLSHTLDDFGCFPLCQNFGKFRSKRKWNGSVLVEIFRSKWFTSRGGPLWLVGPFWPKIAVPFSEISVCSPASARHFTQ